MPYLRGNRINLLGKKKPLYWPEILSLTANAGPVICGPYATVLEGTANYGGLSYTAREALFKGPSYRIRQVGTISQIKIYTGADLTGITGVYVKVWRRNEAGTYNQVGSTTENFLASLVVNTTVTITLATPITGVQVGDYYGLRITKTSGTQNVFRARTGIFGFNITATITVDATAKTFTRDSGSWVDDLVTVGQWITFSGCSNPANNQKIKASAVSALVLTFSDAVGLADEGPTESVKARAGMLTFYVSNATPGTTDYNWESKSVLANAAVPIELFMDTAPHIVGIGDSGMAGQPGTYSFLQSIQDIDTRDATITEQFRDLLNSVYTMQNMGAGGDTTSEILARFAADCVAIKPRIALIDGGTNNLRNGDFNQTNFLSDWTDILDLCRANSIIPIVMLMPPYTNGDEFSLEVANVTVNAAAKTYTRAAGSWVTDGVPVGAWTQWGGFGEEGNNQKIQVTERSALVLTFGNAVGLVNEGPAASVSAVANDMSTIDAWAAALQLCASSYPEAVVLDCRPYVGQFRPEGPAGNLWDYKPDCDADGLHMTVYGYGQAALAGFNRLRK